MSSKQIGQSKGKTIVARKKRAAACGAVPEAPTGRYASAPTGRLVTTMSRPLAYAEKTSTARYWILPT